MTQDATGPAFRPIHNDRVRFYLDHFKIIEEWAAIRGEANEELHNLFLNQVDTLAQEVLARGHKDIDVRADEETNPRKPRIVMSKHGWQNAAGQAPAAIVIEWHNPSINRHGEFTMYVGVRVGDRGVRDERVADRLSGLAPQLRRTLGQPWEAESESFPVWRWILQDGDTLDEGSLLAEARAAAWKCWDVCSGVIDEVV
ncbi:hypothetical protein OWR29_15470 [Actinoplanes sp. Pm04-4]|uniref:Uncharacterized protein n=1 Tax=Paractinoplanes pyxinae TaxID=2997416 RepID=A0ABT4AYS8_9ACTN|nr:hypothetical protein [Actinoplanes pyxinae]MCY1139398.1 hypothetical protein [Actinoplanes pyxinae]